jgi:hypothetical protein
VLTLAQVAFISQEAREKAREIQVKADEEFAIEKVCVTWTRRLHGEYRGLDTTSPLSHMAPNLSWTVLNVDTQR